MVFARLRYVNQRSRRAAFAGKLSFREDPRLLKNSFMSFSDPRFECREGRFWAFGPTSGPPTGSVATFSTGSPLLGISVNRGNPRFGAIENLICMGWLAERRFV